MCVCVSEWVRLHFSVLLFEQKVWRRWVNRGEIFPGCVFLCAPHSSLSSFLLTFSNNAAIVQTGNDLLTLIFIKEEKHATTLQRRAETRGWRDFCVRDPGKSWSPGRGDRVVHVETPKPIAERREASERSETKPATHYRTVSTLV